MASSEFSKNINNSKVIVGLSGGVDSSVAALLLQQQGYIVEGLFMKNWEEDDTAEYCSASADLADAQAVCEKLNIKLHTINFASEYWDNVFTHFLQEYKSGRTPNPDILCNKEIKFKAFLDYAKLLGADFIATGHYAGNLYSTASNQHLLTTAADNNKDQSYFLYTLGQEQLKYTLFPLAGLIKSQIRQLAKQHGFINHDKKDSTGICFIGERKFKDFLQQFLPNQPGEIITDCGQVIGKHDGLMYYTLGQRQGLKIGGLKIKIKNTQNNMHSINTNHPWYVIDKNLATNQLIVAQGENNPLLYKKSLVANQLHWVTGKPPNHLGNHLNSQSTSQQTLIEFSCKAKIRYRQIAKPATVTINSSLQPQQCIVDFNEPERAITPGQSVVFYQDNVCLGGGIIQ